MWVMPAVLALVVAQQVVQTRGCPSDTPVPTDPVGGSTGSSPSPGPEIFQTQDGVRFGVEVLVRNLEIPWAMAFAPDGRLFITERPGRVRIFTLSSGTSDLALT